MMTTPQTADVINTLPLHIKNSKTQWASLPRSTALQQLSELFRGNGWIVSLSDEAINRAILLSYPAAPQTVVLMVKLVAQQHPLTYAQAREELMDFENRLAPHYKCSQFAVIATGGIQRKAEKLEVFNLLLHDEAYIKELERHYSPGKIKEPRIQLFAHNRQTYKKVCRLLNSDIKTIAVVQATGTGKSFLIAKLLQDFSGESRLVMAPSIYIIEQLKEHIRWDAGTIEFMTYARSMNLSQSEIQALNPKMVVLDEYHRCGAEEWGRGVQNILNAYPQAIKIGTSATPVRYRDGARDMSKELFGNHVAENLSLAQAIVRNILPMPRYICALYSLKEDADSLKDRINKSRIASASKKRFLLDIDAAAIKWEQCNGVAAVLQKHLHKNMRKFLVFCASQEHLIEMESTVSGWFHTATDGEPVKTYRICENEPKSYQNLKTFKEADSNAAIHLLFSINMLNEGLHVNEVSGVVLLRPTESPNIFYQQIGRCLKVGLNHTPLIFDLVNNFKSIHSKEFLYDLEFARSQYSIERGGENLESNSPVFTLMDEVREITEVFGEIRFRISDWEHMYERLVEYKERFGTCEVVRGRNPEFESLRDWLYKLKVKYVNGLLDAQQQARLLALGVDLKSYQPSAPKEERWEEKFKELCAFREQFGHCNVGDPHKEHKELKAFVVKQRQRYQLGTLEQCRIDKLLSIGFEFKRNFAEGLWQKHFDELVAHKDKYGHLHVRERENRMLSKWLDNQIRRFRKNKLDPTRQQKLLSVGVEFTEGRDGKVEARLAKLVAWYHEHHHFNFQRDSELYKFAFRLRVNYRRKYLSPDIILRLQAIGFDFEFQQFNGQVKDRRLEQLSEFVKLNGHCEVNKKNETHEGLSEWLTYQRKHYRNKNLSPQLIKKLEALGVLWKYRDKWREGSWNSRYEQLLSIYKKTGQTLVINAKENDKLSAWCSDQRKNHRDGKLSQERIEKLNAIGFAWDALKAQWEENYVRLLAHKDKHGHCRVIKSENQRLNEWCINVRRDYKQGKVSEERVRQLESIGFLWSIVDAVWQEKYERLKIYLQGNLWKDLNKNDISLREWVSKQRKSHKAGKLSEEKTMLLNMLGIEWQPLQSNVNARFNNMLSEFVKYKRIYGTTPAYTDKNYRALWAWCYKLKKRYQENKLSATELQLLNDAGFVWRPK